MLEIGTIFQDRYKILAPLGHGGFGATFLAEDLQSNSKVVMKVPHIEQLGDPAVYERFRREVAIGKLLNHSDVPVALAISEGDPPYLVLKYAEGEPLEKVLSEKGRFPVDQVVKLVPNLLDALHYCHERGVYHRDIKPENLVLAPDGHLKILDFGIALMEGAPRVTWRGFSGLMGTPEYMSPEQIKGERGDAKSDIYAVGCLIYHLLSGSPPFTGDNPLTVMYQHMTKTLEPLTSVKGLHPGIWAAIRRALRRRKEERYDSAEQMANDLRFPENADLKWVGEPGPPLAAVLPTKRNNLLIYGGSVLIAVLIAFLLLFLRR
ncbi:MAG TPA: serine/threonine protein kinase [Deltaproteobacteria bacterium]|nr:serine/threonine protein kinase [Deltaproteobacteria bacterium]